jgi:hypothetical protein
LGPSRAAGGGIGRVTLSATRREQFLRIRDRGLHRAELGAHAIDGEDGNVPSTCRARLEDADRPLVADQRPSYGKPLSQLVEQIDRNAA